MPLHADQQPQHLPSQPPPSGASTYSLSARLAAPVLQCHCEQRTWLGEEIHVSSGRSHPELLWGHPSASLKEALTVTLGEIQEAIGTRVTVLASEVGAAVAAASEVLTRPVSEIRVTLAAWESGGRS